MHPHAAPSRVSFAWEVTLLYALLSQEPLPPVVVTLRIHRGDLPAFPALASPRTAPRVSEAEPLFFSLKPTIQPVNEVQKLLAPSTPYSALEALEPASAPC